MNTSPVGRAARTILCINKIVDTYPCTRSSKIGSRQCRTTVSGVTLPVGAPPLSDEKCPPPPLKFFVYPKKKKKKVGYFFPRPLQLFAPPWSKKRYPKYFFCVDRTLNWTGKYTNKAFFQWKGLKFRKIAPPLYGAPPPHSGVCGALSFSYATDYSTLPGLKCDTNSSAKEGGLVELQVSH